MVGHPPQEWQTQGSPSAFPGFTSNFKTATPLDALLGAWCHRVSVYILTELGNVAWGYCLDGQVARRPPQEWQTQGWPSAFPGQLIPVILKLLLRWLPCQVPGAIGSVLRLVHLVPVYCDQVSVPSTVCIVFTTNPSVY